MDLIKQRDKRTIRRKIAKSKIDNMITLSAKDNSIRLLDEGAVVTAEGDVWFYLKKGALERFLDALDEDFEGYIKYGHTDFANLPILLGSYKKSDLTLRDMGDGRKSLYVTPHFYDTYLLKDIQKMPYDVAVSVEMNCAMDEDASEKLGFPVYSDLFISGFAVVGDGGNVNSNGVRLSGGEKVALDLKSINEALENQSQLDLSLLNEALSKIEDKTVEETPEEPEAVEEELNTEEETVEEEETSIDDVLAKVEELTNKVSELTEENEALNARIETLESDKTALTEKLSAKEAEEKKFVEKFKNLTIHMSDPKPEETKASLDAMDRIGEL